MSLVKRMDELKERVEKLKASQSDIDEAKRLQDCLEDIQDVSDFLSKQVERLFVFRNENIKLSAVPKDLEKAKKYLSNILNRFTNERIAKNLTKGRDWKIMQQSVQDTASTINNELSTAWKDYVTSAYSGDTPNSLDNILAHTDLNMEALENYVKYYNQLNILLKSNPENNQEFKEVREVVKQLQDTYSKFNFDVPDSVKTFLASIGEGGAELELLTKEVRDWLSTNASDNNYKIVAKR